LINGGQIRAARLLVGWTQSQLSLESGVSISSISKIEKVERANEQTMTLGNMLGVHCADSLPQSHSTSMKESCNV